MAPKSTPIPNGTAEAPIEISTIPPVVGINFGNSFASIAVFTKEGLAECIANEDGERQIACAVAFHGEEIYIGNQATHQLVKNSQNTITGFRNLLGKKFSQIPQNQSSTSAPVIQHPTIADTPAYRVQILQPAPAPLPASNNPSSYNTPAASHAATPRSEPTPAERVLTVSEVTTIFLKSLVQSAEDFLGKKVQGAVITVPSNATEEAKDALEKCAEDAGVKVLQLLEEAGAAAATTTSLSWTSDSTDLAADRTQLLIDLGHSALHLSLLSIRSGLAYTLASSHTAHVGGRQIDDKIIKHFATEFTKKTKTPLTIVPANDPQDKRAEAKLRIAVEHTKRTISASPGAATCSVESLKDGVDFTGSINRMRFDLVVKPVYTAVSNAITALLADAGVDASTVDEIVYVGGSTCLPGLDEHICLACGFKEDVQTPFARGSVVGGGVGDPTTVLARGCAVQAELIASLSEEDETLRGAFTRGSSATAVKATSRTIGVLIPGKGEGSTSELGGLWVPVVLKETPLPARRAVSFDASLTEESKALAVEVWEVEEGIRIEKVKPPKVEYDDDEEEEEEIELKHPTVTKKTLLGVVRGEAKMGIKATGKVRKAEEKGKWSTTLEVEVVLSADGAVEVRVGEKGGESGAVGIVKI